VTAGKTSSLPTRQDLDAARTRTAAIRRRMIALQEELDWRCYRLYGLTEEELTLEAVSGAASVHGSTGSPRTEGVLEIDLGERAFEIVMARQMARGELETSVVSRS